MRMRFFAKKLAPTAGISASAPIGDLLAQALELIPAGYACFPCHANKLPATPHGFLDATKDAGELLALFRRYPGPLIGVATGVASGFDVLDLDAKHPEASSWWRDNRYRLPNTRTHRTRARGLHLLFRHAEGVRNTASRIASGVDTRGDGGFAIWWPAAGLPVLCDAPLAFWPDWLLAAMKPRSERRADAPRVPDDRTIRALVRFAATAAESQRNNRLFWTACRMSGLVASGLLTEGAAEDLLVQAGSHAGLPEPEARPTARSGFNAGRTGR
jgi:hypothetical protein